MCSERPNMKSMLHSLPRFYGETPAVCSPTMGFDRTFTNFKIETLRKFTSGIIYQFKSPEKLHSFYDVPGFSNIGNSAKTRCYHLEYGR